MRTFLVVGSAPCLYSDLQRALYIRPFSSVMLVNGACTAVVDAEHMLCGHEEKSEFFVRARGERFPSAPPIRVHATTFPHRQKECAALFPSVTDWHNHEKGVGATSASKAAKICFELGATEVILCGCPLNEPGYFEGEARVPQHVMCERIGDHGKSRTGVPVQEMRIIKGYREKFKILAETEFKNRVFSMSGFTRDCLGEPREDRRL